MGQFSELVRKVIKLSNRPDLEEEIKISIRDATIALHQLEFFPRDLRNGVVTNTKGRSVTFSIPLTTFPRLRAIANVTPFSGDYNSPNFVGGRIISPLTANPSLSYCTCNTNWWTNTGGNLTLHSNTVTSKFYVEYYENPVIFPDESYNSWLAELYPLAITNYALMLLFRTVRDTVASNSYEQLVGTREGRPSGNIGTILMEQLQQQVRGA